MNRRNRAGWWVRCIAVFLFVPVCAVHAATVTFDFDTGTPMLSTGQSVPFTQTTSDVTAQFSSPQGSVFSVQTDTSTGFRLSQFSGHYLYPNNLDRNVLRIGFSQPLSHITLTFATSDFQQVEIPTTIQLTAYVDSTGTPPVGSATAHGEYAGDTMPMGTLSFTSAMPFNLVELVLPYQPQGSTDFLVDNIMVITTTVVPTATPTPTPTPTPTLTPSPACVGDCNGDGQVTVNELVVMVNIVLEQMPLIACTPGDASRDGVIAVNEIVAGVDNALRRCTSVSGQTISVPGALDQPNVDVGTTVVYRKSPAPP